MVREIMFLLALGILALLALLWIPAWMIKRNASEVIRIFHRKNAIGIQNAKTKEELGLEPMSILQPLIQGKIFSRRNWKPKALDLLIQTNVVLMTEDGKLYITEASLASATWLKPKK
jgi:hypothetical protein